MVNKFDVNKILDELMTDSLGCIRYIKKNEDLNISMISKDDIELKRLQVVSNSELELIEKELESKEAKALPIFLRVFLLFRMRF